MKDKELKGEDVHEFISQDFSTWPKGKCFQV